MAYRTRYGKRYHMTLGCHGATIPCDTKGLSPCSDCCGKGSGAASANTPSPAGASVQGTIIRHGSDEIHIGNSVIETREIGAGGLPLSGTMYRLDGTPSETDVARIDALPGVSFMPNEWSLDQSERTSAFIVYDKLGVRESGYTIDYASNLADLGVKALNDGLMAPVEDDTDSISAWLASNGESEWQGANVSGLRLDMEAEPLWQPAIHDEFGDQPGYTFIPFEGQHRLADTIHIGKSDFSIGYLLQLSVNNAHLPIRGGQVDGRAGIIVEEGHDFVARNTDKGVKLGVRKQYETEILKDAKQADWQVVRSGKRGDTMEATGTAYRTPAGDATITMHVEPDPYFPGQVRTTVRVHDPYIGQNITLVQGDSSSREDAFDSKCPFALREANKGPRSRIGIRSEYERALPKLARQKIQDDGIEVTEVIPVSRTEVEVRGLAGGYEPVRRRVMFDRDMRLESYAK